MEELFARLQKSSASDQQSPAPSASTPAAYREPSVSSPIYSPAPAGPLPHHASNVLSPNTSVMNTPHPEGASAPTRTTDLLSLLKFRQSSGSIAIPPASSFDHNILQDTTSGAQGRPSSAADLVAGFNRRPNAVQSPSALAPAASRPELRGEASGSSSSPQDFLLKLLNQAPRPYLGDSSPVPQTPHTNVMTSDHDSALPSSSSTKARKSPFDTDLSIPLPTDSHRETVSEVLSGVGEVVDRQVEEALAQVALRANGDSAPKVLEDERAVQEAAAEIKEELKDDKKREAFEGDMPEAMAQAFEETIDAVAEPTGADEDWEKAAERGATTYTLPMQPFKSIQIGRLEKYPPLIPQSMTMDIARVKRPFDQIDRNLVAATQNLMLYPLKSGGLRVIRQETGVHKEVFKHVPERIFNVSVSVKKKTGAKDTEVVLATGVEGSVFWAPLSSFAASDDADVSDSEEARGFVFPPVPSGDENTSGGQLKTRVKPSYRHPEYFAYGRGKSIYIIYPSIVCNPAYCERQTHVCKSEKYLKEHMLRISTGKAGKDFIFSADDSLILSLDKAGRLKFWDIRNLLNDGYDKSIGAQVPLEIKVPLMTLATCPATEKSWPTSIHLVDKDKPMTKGIALRYVIIGLKQNHTLQLWDLMLGKPVQEISFPHEQESDAICSVVFHAKTSILTVAHPTRNSIYFLHLSIPPYTLTPMSQSKFISTVAEKDGNLPPPQSTIIVNGMREYKFSNTSTIRSLDILTEPGSHYGDEAPAFVLYIMHSNGISELKVDRTMLGLSETSRVVGGTPAMNIKDAIRVDNIKTLPPAVAGDTGSVTSEAASVVPSNGIEEARKGGRRVDHTPTRISKTQERETESSNDKPEKKKRKEKKAQGSPDKAAVVPSFAPPAEFAKAVAEAEPLKARAIARKLPSETETTDSKATTSFTETVTGSSHDTSSNSRPSSALDYSYFEALLKSEFETLQHSIAQDRLKQDAAATTRQEAVLKAVSRTLTENVEDSLSRVVTDGLTKVTISPLKDMVASTIDRQLSTAFNQAMKVGVPRELQKSLPVAIGQTMKDKDIMQSVAAQISQNVTQQVDGQFKAAMQNTITPTISKLAVSAVKQMTSEMERRFGEQLRALEIQKQKDDNTIDGLYKAIGSLQQTLVEMAHVQQKFQQESLAMLAQVKAAPASHPPSAASAPITPAKQILSPADREREQIQDAFAHNEVEEATLKWMHSDRKVELFDEVFLYVDPRFLNTLSPLLILSVAATVSEKLSAHLRERLHWVDLCLAAISMSNANELQDVLPNVLEVILQRIQQSYMQISQVDFQDPMLKNMHLVARKISDLKLKVSA